MSAPLPTTLEGLLLESQRLFTKVGQKKFLFLSADNALEMATPPELYFGPVLFSVLNHVPQ